ncbi:hypothetical protein OG444_22875 [Streptomyces sp. NBC_01232]|uniref:hypothetical protein n=1 Tax=Streptomyces sp. NBC_01232 TaxID=2903786 RepID=UPI002E0E692B|nr:hypothetical protein OG444_22875 [Streptomyces sp. NBC_01232]
MSGTEWGDVASWAAFALAGGAFVVSLKARGDSRRSAAATVRAADAAEASVTEARKSADGAVRSASAAEEALALQRDDASARRAAEEEARRPRVVLDLQHHRGNTWHLINIGTAPALNVRLLTAFDFRPPEFPEGLSLGLGAVHPFVLFGSISSLIPAHLEFTWDGLDDPVRLRVPPKP